MKTYIAVVLDESGSMDNVREETIEGFNEQVQSIKEEEREDDEVYVSLITFNNNVDEVFVNERVDKLDEVDRESYQPGGTTALLDAIGYTVDLLVDKTDLEDEDSRYLVIVMTDGRENASQDYDYEEISYRIGELEKQGNWTFTYMGALQDLEDIADTLNMNVRNTVYMDSIKEGYKKMNVATASYLESDKKSCKGFYDSVDVEEE